MTEKLYDSNAYLKEFSATVLDSYEKADGYFTILDKTAFFPEGGGQPADIGFLDGVRVYDVQIKDGIIYHYTTKRFEKGQAVKGEVDFSRRFDFMQQHSAEHIVSGIAHKHCGCENVGFHLGGEIVTLDFDKALTKEQIQNIEELANDAVFGNSKINCYYPTKEELGSINYRSKKELEGDIRIVEIEGVDCCACCAPHVKTTGEVGLIKLLSAEALRGGVRLELKAGKRAFLDYSAKHLSVLEISSTLCAKQNEVAEAVKRLQGEITDLRFQLNGLKRKAIIEKAEALNPEKAITAIFEEDFEIKDLQLFADTLYKKYGGIRAVLSKANEGFYFAICGDSAELDSFFAEFKTKFQVKGGGRNGMVQGTVVSEKSELEEYFVK